MTFDPPDPQSGQKLEDYFTVEYVKQLNAAVRRALKGGNVSGGPGITVSQVGGSVTIKAAKGGKGGVLTLPPIEENGIWVLTTNDGELEWRETESCP